MSKKRRSHPLYEAEVIEGLEDIAETEIREQFPDTTLLISEYGRIRFRYSGEPRLLLNLKTIAVINSVQKYDIPRPKGLLGHQHFTAFLKQIAHAQQLHPPGSYETLFINAAGSDSSVMMRLKQELAAHTGLAIGEQQGDLTIRIRRSPDKSTGWETLVRLSHRPLTTRSWRVCNMEGALNATVAHAISILTESVQHGTFLNIMCGSGSLLIEHLTHHVPSGRVIGCDISPEALNYAQQNIDAAGFSNQVRLLRSDVCALPFADQSIHTIVSDLPFGQAFGSHEENIELYPLILQETARVAANNARLVLISHEVRLLESLLRESPHWKTRHSRTITLRGLHPRIIVLDRIELV